MSLIWSFMDIHNLHNFMPKEPNVPKGHKDKPLSNADLTKVLQTEMRQLKQYEHSPDKIIWTGTAKSFVEFCEAIAAEVTKDMPKD